MIPCGVSQGIPSGAPHDAMRRITRYKIGTDNKK